ncbi:receptor-like protein kinase 1 [Actinidia rufa]|uniref:Receptor-like protein kinase 1 n=1 Tax=Actinidia rufa TaxID=165716 RepID=A0A7J0FM07_9ERIC|nr:receptor-like protein kinase 1 [Actinidia rufa]
MACALPHILFFLLFLLPLSTVAQTNGTVATGVPVPSGSKVLLTANRGLVLSDPQGKELWSSENILNDVTHGFMNDSGNFVLVRSDSVTLWESFKYPTDTMLPTQIMESGGVLFSRQTETNFSRGRFQLRLLEDGNLVLNTRELATGFTYDAYFWSNTYDADNTSNRGYQVIFNETGYFFVLRRNNRRVNLTPKLAVPTSDYYHRVTLDFDGVLNQYYHSKTATGNPKWTALWSQPDNICVAINAKAGIGACGFNSICTLNDYGRPECSCPGRIASALFPFLGIMACWKKKLPLSNGRKDANLNSKAFMKYRKGDPLSPPTPQSPVPDTKKNDRSLILVGSVLLGSSLFVNFVLVCVIGLGFFLICHKKIIKIPNSDSAAETNLRCFTYTELVEATGGFKEELGRGAFGIVYKGVIQTSGSGNAVAVKKLDGMRSISCRKSVGYLEINCGEENAILTDWAFDCFLKGRLADLVGDDMEALNDWNKVERFLMVGLWCIQEDPSLRPSMRKVTQMLEGVVEVGGPPCPSQFSFTG